MTPEKPNPARFFGLDPARTLDVLESPPYSPPDIPGWHILGIAGKGGFGTVWHAQRESDGAEAAIKIASADDPETLERIEEEISALRSLHHPHIVSLLDHGTANSPAGDLFLAMSFIDGMDLSQKIPQSGLSLEDAFLWFRQICSAVIHAHEHGIVHRDLKPANIMIDEEGNVKVADFGLALPVHRRVHQLSLTRAGMVAGTAEYLPPEAYRQDYHPCTATDIFALGVILHEMLSGAPPRGAWPPISSNRRVDIRLDDLIRRALSPDPRQRWKSVQEMLDAFEQILSSTPRYAGASLVTSTIRFTDLLWTLTGLWILLAASSSMLHLRKSSFSLPFDLIGRHSELIGGYHAVFVLLQPALALGIWQLLRLRRFRHIPMREALPTPFGLRLGNGRMAAALTAFCQLFCFWLPALLIAQIFCDCCTTWLRVDDPAWRRGLAVVSWQDGSLVSPWTYHTPGQGFWIYDCYGPPQHPLFRSVDKLGFTPLVFPVMMSLGALSLVIAMVATLFTAMRQWWSRERRIATMCLAIPAIACPSLFAAPVHAFFHPEPPQELKKRYGNWTNLQMTSHVRWLAEFLIGTQKNVTLLGSATHWTDYYADTVHYRQHGLVPRHDIERLWQEENSRAGAMEIIPILTDYLWTAKDDTFTVRARAIEAFDPHDTSQPSTAAELILTLDGTITKEGITSIHRETLERIPLYETAAQAVTPEQAIQWVHDFLAANRLSATDPTAAASLTSLFHPLPFSSARKINFWLHTSPTLESAVMAIIRDHLDIDGPDDIVVSGSRPGGRTRVRLRMKKITATSPSWLSIDLIHLPDGVKAVAHYF